VNTGVLFVGSSAKDNQRGKIREVFGLRGERVLVP